MKAALLCLAFFLSFNIASAATNYTTLAPIQGYVPEEVGVGGGTLGVYLNSMVKLIISLCTGLAVLMIIIGGLQYASSDAWSKKSDGKERIVAALFGLLIALGSWVLLNTIDPRLLDTSLTLQQVEIEGIATQAPRPATGTGTNRPIETVRDKPVEPVRTNPYVPGQITGAKMPQDEMNQYLLSLINGSQLPNLSPSDMAKYFPNGATPEAWASLFASIIQKESNFNQNLTYQENFKDRNGNFVISTGLMQISQESARAYGFPGITTEQLKDPKTNMQVGVAIMQKWVQQDGCISCKNSAGEWRGGARYWSTLR